ncbi:Dabb family protein [Yoonia sp.]|uniref:Dabb family protein n=1 Tax=Yoonia sp. TaxID=2212373 RepID=UPI0025E61AFC|nr:Dabb family protein [Yoonia sp.]
MSDRPTLRHVVFFSAKDKADLPEIVVGLELLAGIPDASLFEVRQNTQSDTLSSEVDVIVYAEFESAKALAAYKAHPLYEASIQAVRPLRDMRIAADF